MKVATGKLKTIKRDRPPEPTCDGFDTSQAYREAGMVLEARTVPCARRPVLDHEGSRYCRLHYPPLVRELEAFNEARKVTLRRLYALDEKVESYRRESYDLLLEWAFARGQDEAYTNGLRELRDEIVRLEAELEDTSRDHERLHRDRAQLTERALEGRRA